MLSACWLIGAYFLAVSSHKRGRLNTSVYGINRVKPVLMATSIQRPPVLRGHSVMSQRCLRHIFSKTTSL